MRDVVEFSLDRIAWAAGAHHRAILALAERIASLDHEARNDAVEPRSIIETFLRKRFKVLDVAGRFVRKEGDFDLAEVGIEDCYIVHFFLGDSMSLPLRPVMSLGLGGDCSIS